MVHSYSEVKLNSGLSKLLFTNSYLEKISEKEKETSLKVL